MNKAAEAIKMIGGGLFLMIALSIIAPLALIQTFWRVLTDKEGGHF